ncbi:MAG: hypothetical protein EU548_09960, partial [Promethearchaeota archaeon]
MILLAQGSILDIISLSEIIGAIIATLFAILTWFITEKLNSWVKWRRIQKGFNNLYHLLLKRTYEPNTSVELVNIILEDIKEKNFK